jgi:hypothetical protein
VLAEPLPAAGVQAELDQLVNQILPLARGEVSEAKRIALERAQARHRELTRAQDGGVWRVRLLVGGVEPAGARTAAALLCAAAELEGRSWLESCGCCASWWRTSSCGSSASRRAVSAVRLRCGTAPVRVSGSSSRAGIRSAGGTGWGSRR